MFHSDQPISKKENDCLNRTEFSKQLAEAIWSYGRKDNFAISLCGKWGSGKTSILNMVIEEIEDKAKSMPVMKRPVIIKFNPWNCSDCSQLISQFFITIQEQLKLDGNSKALGAVGKVLESYSSLLDYSTYIPGVGDYLKLLKAPLSAAGKNIRGNVEKGNSIEAKKKKVIEALEKQEQKFIVVIDDIDRLNNVQIRAIFQLVNSLAGFPNMIYLLSFDKEVVTRALQEEQKCNGEEYLEKIIQVPFEVPEANKKLVDDVLINKYAEIIMKEEDDDIIFETEYWSEVFSNCVSPLIKSIRDVNRVMNAFEFKYGLMRDEINSIDLLAITTLQVCASPIYQWISKNTISLTGSIASIGGISGVEQKGNKTAYLEKFDKIYTQNPELMLRVLQTLFPAFSWKTGGYTSNRDSEPELQRKYRIASAERFKRYFNLSLEEIAISKRQVKNTIYNYSQIQLKEYLEQLSKEYLLVTYLNELQAFISEIPQERKCIFLKELVEIQTNDYAYERKNIFLPLPAARASHIAAKLLEQGGNEENAKLLQEIIEECNVKCLSIICKTVEDIEEAYGRIGNYENSTNQFVALTDLENIEKTLIKKIKKFAETKCYFDYKGIESVCRIWEYLDKETLDKYITNMLHTSVNVPKYLSLCAGVWSGGKTSGWSFERESFLEYIGKEEAYEKILSLKNTKEFSALPRSFKEIAIAFFLWYNQETPDRHSVNKESVNAMIPQWEVVS